MTVTTVITEGTGDYIPNMGDYFMSIRKDNPDGWPHEMVFFKVESTRTTDERMVIGHDVRDGRIYGFEIDLYTFKPFHGVINVKE